MSGNLSHQIEHHLFPDLPARRYPQIAEEVREICERYGLAYNTGPLHRQLGSVAKKIFKMALPPKRKQPDRSEEHTSELQSLMRISYAAFCLKKTPRPLQDRTTDNINQNNN